MNKEIFPATGDNDFDRPPEQELVTLFASCAPSARPVDIDALLPSSHNCSVIILLLEKPLVSTSLCGGALYDLCRRNNRCTDTVRLGKPVFVCRNPREGGANPIRDFQANHKN